MPIEPEILLVHGTAAGELRSQLAHYLVPIGYELVDWFGNGSVDSARADDRALAMFLDNSRSHDEALSWCRKIREHGGDIPIVMFTAQHERMGCRAMLEAGADYCLPKPVDAREVLACLNALRRRSARSDIETHRRRRGTHRWAIGSYVVDMTRRKLLRDGVEIALGGVEFELLCLFVRFPRQVLGREQLQRLVGGRISDPRNRTLEAQISRIRELVEENPRMPRYIQTVRGSGYMFLP